MILCKTRRLILRDWEPEDRAALVRIAGQEGIRQWLPDWQNCALWADQWLDGRARQREQPPDLMARFMSWAIVLAASGEVIGMISAGGEEYGRQAVGIGYFLDEWYTGRGYMTEAVRALCTYVFRSFPYSFLIAAVQPDNLKSVKVLRRAGFRYFKQIPGTFAGQDEPVLYDCYRRWNPYEKWGLRRLVRAHWN